MFASGLALLLAMGQSAGSIIETLSFNERGIGKVEVGQSQANNPALAHSFYIDPDGNPGSKPHKCDLRAIEGSDNSYAWVLDNQIAVAGTADPAIALPSGLKVGMTFDDMKRLEPHLKKGPTIARDEPDMTQYYARLSTGNQLRVTIVDDEISEIAIGRKMNAAVTC